MADSKRTQQLYLTATQIDAAVRKLYAKNGYVVLSEVRNGTGYEKRVRTADMVVISTWPSRGLFAEGIEIKSDKGDLRRELEHPEKADEIARFCTRWWIAIPEGLSEGLLIPANWGIISVDDKLKATVSKPGLMLTPVTMDALFVCSVLRNFSEGYVPMAEVQPLIAKAKEEERKNAEHNKGYRLKELEEKLKAFLEHSGIDLLNEKSWGMRSIGEAVRLIAALREQPINNIIQAKQSLSAGLSAIDAALDILDTSEKL